MALIARAKRRLWTLILAVVTASTAAYAARPELSETEIVDLQAGRMVSRPDEVDRDGRHYIGGVSYVMIDAPAEQVLAVLGDVRTYREILPRTRSLRWFGIARNGDAIIELEQGNAIAHGKYVARVHRDEPKSGDGPATVRFWLDHRYPHDIADANGFFHVESVGDRTLVTYLVMVDLGGGWFSGMFEGRIRRAALSTPMLVKKYVESHRPS
ncbi:MAG: SRPBCC family protein [Polyangiaceae bacterium]